MSIAYKFPEAFKRGAEAAKAHYERFYRGEIGELCFPPHPYPSPEETCQRETEWHAYNAGWYAGIPDDDEDARRRPQNVAPHPDGVGESRGRESVSGNAGSVVSATLGTPHD